MRVIERERADAQFLQDADLRFRIVMRSFHDSLEALRAVNLLFVASGDVTREEFDAFAGPLSQAHPETRAVIFHRLVVDADRDAFEAARRKIFPSYQITEQGPGGLVRAPRRPVYLVVDYLVPYKGNEIILGYNVFSYLPQRELFKRAIETGQAGASGVMPLMQIGGGPGLVIVMPVYRPGATLADPAARAAAVIGDTAVSLDLAGLLQRNLDQAGVLAQPGIALDVRGIDHLASHAYRFGAYAAPLPWWRQWFGAEPRTAQRTIEVAGSRWQLTVRSRKGALPGHVASNAILALSLLLTLVTASYIQARALRTRRIELLVRQRTRALKRAGDALRLYQRAVESSANGIILVDALSGDNRIAYVNPAYERLKGRTAAQLLALRVVDLADEGPDEPGMQEMLNAMRERRAGHAVVRQRGLNGRARYSEVYIAPVNRPDGVIDHFVLSVYDVTTAKRYEEELERRARYDSLTGLANRAQLKDRLEQAMSFAAADGAPLWTVALDLDQFRFVNDTLGHGMGDQLLRQAAPRIAQALPRTDTVARTGGDEFVLILTGCRDERSAATTVRRVLDALAEPLVLGGQTLVVTGSAGVAAFPGDGQDAETLIKHAEVAMYRAKEAGRNTVQFYRPAMTARALERLELEGALRHALAHGEFELHYQPQVDVASGQVVGMEALLRWRHPRLGLVQPERFIGLAEETGLIVPIGAWVLRTAALQNRAWQRAGYGPLRIAVNMSARQFAEPGLAREVAAVLAESGLAPDSLEVEVTESLVMTDAEAAIATMHELKAMGVAMSIDDFGTGYSSLSYLKRFPVDVLKIDRSFVHDLAGDSADAAMVDAIISLARGLRLRVIAEGVETCAQLDYLRDQGCDLVQGYLYSRALPVAEAEQLLRAGRRVEPNTAAA
ncbi:EAL domain-containing protein [Massilia horti]|uniref:EAL domain-containing protein n=2 Tax=Massilia horti TaxID=2562153 RepID=A0A4Y9T4Y1_9BURK|nr:EAL domain-containing protein [Massilia horti]